MKSNSGKKDTSPGFSRRKFLTTTALAAGGVSVMGTHNPELTPDRGVSAGSSGDLSLSAAGYRFRRLEALFDGRVKIDRCDTGFEQMRIGDMNTHIFVVRRLSTSPRSVCIHL